MDSATASTKSIAHLTFIGRHIWNIILRKLHPKDITKLTMCINKELKVFLTHNTDWTALIKLHYTGYCYAEEQDIKSHYRRLNYSEYDRALDQRRPFVKFFLLTKEKHEQEFGMPCYGVCDSPEQLAAKYPKYRGRVYFRTANRESQPKERGWRFHKYGPYVGKHNLIGIEYLREANGKHGKPLIDETWMFHRHDKCGICYTFRASAAPKLDV